MEILKIIKEMPQQVVYTIQTLLCIVASISVFIKSMITQKEGRLLGKTYGKSVSMFGWIVALLLQVISIVSILAYMIIIALNMFFTFFEGKTFKKLGFMLLGLAIIAAVWFFSNTIFAAIRDSKSKKEINDILNSNPVFSEAVNRLEKDKSIKMIKIYRDGIAFYNYVNLPENVDEKISVGATTNSEARKIVNSKKDAAFCAEGKVLTSNCTNIIRYIDYDYNDSESAMYDISRYLLEYLSPKFEKKAYKRSWNYHMTYTSGPSGYMVSGNGMVSPTGYSSKTVEASAEIVLYEVLYEKEEKKEIVKEPSNRW